MHGPLNVKPTVLIRYTPTRGFSLQKDPEKQEKWLNYKWLPERLELKLQRKKSVSMAVLKSKANLIVPH